MKVILLVGQSNMQGKGSVKHLDDLVQTEPDTFGHLKKDGKWDREFNRDDGKKYKPATTGWAYKQIFNEMHTALDDIDKTFPELAGRKHEIVGLVWFQGWNDLINGQRRAEYKDNLVLFIRDIRKHLGAANLPTAPYWDDSVKYDGGYHYHGSARFYYGAGKAFGEAMLELIENQKK